MFRIIEFKDGNHLLNLNCSFWLQFMIGEYPRLLCVDEKGWDAVRPPRSSRDLRCWDISTTLGFEVFIRRCEFNGQLMGDVYFEVEKSNSFTCIVFQEASPSLLSIETTRLKQQRYSIKHHPSTYIFPTPNM
jgi:hypothetical protein